MWINSFHTKAQSMTPGVLYVAHLPRGLFEPQLKAYFKQFGTVLRVRVSRSKKVCCVLF